MNVQQIADQQAGALRVAIEAANKAISDIESAAAKTREVLQVASKHGVTTIGLNRSLGESSAWGRVAYGNLFTPEADRIDNWPAAWTIAEQSGISAGCGNSGQHQIPSGSVIDGVYVCIDGAWERLSDEDAIALYDKNATWRRRR